MSGALARLAVFARALRARQVRVSLGDEVDAATALTLVDLADVAEVRRALRTAFKVRHRDWAAFDAAFGAVWLGREAGPPPERRNPDRHRALPVRSPVGVATRGEAPGAPRGQDAIGGGTPGYSPHALLRPKPPATPSPRDLAAMDRLVARLAERLATERSRRLVPAGSRGLVDLRHSLRRSLGTRGELVVLARRARAVEEPRLVVLCDTSGSMDAHTQLLLTFAISLRRVVRRLEVFAFNTSLTRLTPWLHRGNVARTLRRLSEAVPDWSGGTRIGACLGRFVAEYATSCVGRRTVVVIVSDGLDRGEPDELVRAMRWLKARARKLVWLNPLLGDPRYQPTARGMQAALPFVDRFAAAHDLASLERLVSVLAV